MDLPGYNNSYLLDHFREFYREVAHLRQLVEFSASISIAGESRPMLAEKPAAVSGVWQQLLTLLERQAIEAGQSGGAFAFEVYREAQYVMAALADEIFLHLEWDGRSSWPLLESRLFQSHVAGELVFERIDRVLQRRDAFYLDLASVYFMALSLGFQGKFRGEDPAQLDRYRRQLFELIYRRNPKLFTDSGTLMPEAYQHTLDKGGGKRLPDQRVWLALVGLVLVVWLGASQLIWSGINSRLSCYICRATSTNCVCDTGSSQ